MSNVVGNSHQGRFLPTPPHQGNIKDVFCPHHPTPKKTLISRARFWVHWQKHVSPIKMIIPNFFVGIRLQNDIIRQFLPLGPPRGFRCWQAVFMVFGIGMIQARVSRFFTKEKTSVFFSMVGWKDWEETFETKPQKLHVWNFQKVFKTSWCDNSGYGTDNYQTSFTPFMPHHIWYIYIYI